MVPLLRNVIKGAIWMQGEANAGADGRLYNCSFPVTPGPTAAYFRFPRTPLVCQPSFWFYVP